MPGCQLAGLFLTQTEMAPSDGRCRRWAREMTARLLSLSPPVPGPPRPLSSHPGSFQVLEVEPMLPECTFNIY